MGTSMVLLTWWRCSARRRETRRGDVCRHTFVLGHGTPHTVGLTYVQRVLAAALQDRAAQAHGLGGAVPTAACRPSLTLGVEEECRIADSSQVDRRAQWGFCPCIRTVPAWWGVKQGSQVVT